jgi:UPF0716 protein FxsA
VLARLFLLFIVLPLVELALLLKLAEFTSPEFTFAVVLVTGGVGIFLARTQGLRVWWRIQEEMSAGRLPKEALLDGVLILVAGAVLLTPGVLTDALGLSLLFPPTRRIYRRWLIRRFQSAASVQFHTSAPANDDAGRVEVIDSYVVEPSRDEE